MGIAKATLVGAPGKRRRPAHPLALTSLILGLLVFLSACGAGPTPTTGAAATTPTTAATGAATTAATAAATSAAAAQASPTRAASPATSTAGTTASPTRAASSPAASPVRTGSPAAGATPNTAIRISGKQGDADSLNGTGATFPQVLYSRWFSEYERVTGVKVNYQGTGSSAGKNAIRDQTADFAGSDSPMSDQEQQAAAQRCGDNIVHIPTALGAIVVAYNPQGMPSGAPLKLDGDTIAGIFLGDIAKWNDPKIAAQNPGVTLPNEDIITVHRSDGSGTTDNFTSYLAAVNAKWRDTVRSGTTVNWPGGIGAQGNQGVAGEIKNNPYAIGYVELAFAKQSQLPYADVKNQAGQHVTATAASVTAAGEAFAPQAPPDLRFKLVNAAGAQSYPITAVTWILVCPKQTDQAKAVALTRMLWWATHDAQRLNEELDYAPIPPSFQVRAEQFISAVTVNNQRAFPGR